MKNSTILYLGIGLVILIYIILNLDFSKETDVTVVTEVHQLTSKEFKKIGRNGFDSPAKEDFRKLVVTVSIDHTENVVNQNVEIPDFKKVINALDSNTDRHWSELQANQPGLNTYEYVFLATGLDDRKIRNGFKEQYVKVTLELKENEALEELIDISKIMEFKN